MFSFHKRINTKKDSIFYSLYKVNDRIIGAAREKYNEHKSLLVELNNDFEIIVQEDFDFKAEDPRLFCVGEDVYMTDNFMHSNRLYNFSNKKITNIKLDGKNYPFFCHKGKMYAIHVMNPFSIYSVDFETGNTEKFVEFPFNKNYRGDCYRGGTTAYINPWVKDECLNLFGFGHTTYKINNWLIKHDIYLWKLKFDEDINKIVYQIYDIDKPLFMKNICDATSVIELDGKYYIITAESDREWFCEQDYVTNVYKLNTKYLSQLLTDDSGWKFEN